MRAATSWSWSIAALAAALFAGCHVDVGEPEGAASALNGRDAPPPVLSAAAPAAPQILDAATLAKYKAALPKVAYGRLADLLLSPSTLYWDKATMIPSYQDSVGDGAGTPIGARANAQGRAVIVPEGKRLFSDDGTTWAFPFAHTAGTDRSTNVFVVNFMTLPAKDGKLLPVVYDRIDDPNGKGGLGLHRWTWMFPKGTVLGEILFIKDAAGALLPSEIRTRTRWIDGWAVNVFRPFPTAASLSARIKALRPGYATSPALAAVIAHLADPGTLEPVTLTSPAFGNLFTASGAIDTLPDLGDDALVRELLRTTPFVSAYQETWQTKGAQRTYAASTKAKLSIVPDGYEAGLLPVNETSCASCHRDAGRAIDDFEPQAILYGDIWGQDRIFSFHPWDQSRYASFNNENRAVRPGFGEIVVPRDPAKHPGDLYRKL
jgi:hypothetical protein